MKKVEREYRKIAKRFGCKLSRPTGSHYHFEFPSGGVVVASSTRSDHRATKNLLAQLRRAKPTTP